MKTPRDARAGKESNELDTNVPLHLTCLRKFPIYAFAVPIFGNFLRKLKMRSRIPFSLSDLVFALRRPPEYSKTGSFHKSQIGPFWGGKLGWKEV